MSIISKRVRKILDARLKAKDKEYDEGMQIISTESKNKAMQIMEEAEAKLASARYEKRQAEKALEDKLVAEILGETNNVAW